MYGVVLAAGEGPRLRPLTAERSKGLVEVAGTPLLTRCLETLRSLGVDELVVVVGYRAGQIVSSYGDCLVVNGDNVCRANLSALVDRHTEIGAGTTLLVDDVTREAASETGVLAFDDDGRLTGLVEKPSNPPSTTSSRRAGESRPSLSTGGVST